MKLGPPPRAPRRAIQAWLRSFLAFAGVHRPLERLGQHFLVDPSVISAFRRELAGLGGDMLEVGPGPGVLTYHVAPVASRVVAVEIDYRLALALGRAGFLPANVAIVHGDGVRAAESPGARVVYSNTPYNIASPLMEAISYNPAVKAAVLMLQKEVALRLTAAPGDPDYGRLTVLVRRFFHVRIAGFFGRRSFYPPPRVDSALVVLERFREPTSLDRVVDDLVRCMFTQRNRLAVRVFEQCAGVRAGDAAALLAGRRVRELAPEDFVELARYAVSSARR